MADDPGQILADIQAVDPDSHLSPIDTELYHSQLPGYYTPDALPADEESQSYRIGAWDE